MSGRGQSLIDWKGLARVLRLVICITAILIATVLWLEGLCRSPLMEPRRQAEEQFVRNHLRMNSPDGARERVLAESYWRRYRDVRNDAYWGEHGPMGIWGPRDHYRQHGRREGRIFQPLVEVPDSEAERILAEAYWDRYPEVRHSSIWGEHSDLGILGPRDHFIHIGTALGLIWGPPENQPVDDKR